MGLLIVESSRGHSYTSLAPGNDPGQKDNTPVREKSVSTPALRPVPYLLKSDRGMTCRHLASAQYAAANPTEGTPRRGGGTSDNKQAIRLGRDTGLLSEAQTGRAGGNVVDHVLALEEDVAEDVQAEVVVGLDAAEAGAAAGRDGRVVDVLAGHGLGDAADGDGEVGEGGRAREDVAALALVELGAADLGVVGPGDGSVDVDQGGASVSDALDAGADGGAGTDRVACGAEAPETIAVVDGGVGDGTGVLGAIDEAEVIGTGGVVLEVDREELLGERALDGVEEGGLLLGRDGVDAAEGKTEKTVGVLVLGELRRDGRSGLDSLRGGSHASNGDLISVDLAGCTGAVTVGDPPGVAALDLGGIDLVVVVARKLVTPNALQLSTA